MKTTLYVLFTLSGFTGLVYESLWTQYLRLFLGHAAYAQALVLATFMGGLALGSWLCGRYTGRWTNLLLGYAVAEGAIGLFALIFHPVFEHATAWAYASIIPGLGGGAAVAFFRWALAAALILPQTVLLGMTFPLIAAGIVRGEPGTAGRPIALLYFLNSFGGALGVLGSGFLLVRFAGLPGTMRLVGVINLAIAGVAWSIAHHAAAPAVPAVDRNTPQSGDRNLLLIAAFLTGATSFLYEIGWIRMLSLVLGSATHSFELMLFAFIIGLAFGGLWVRTRIARTDPVRLLVAAQIVMGLGAILSLPAYNQTFGIMQWLMQTLPKSDAGYALFKVASGALSLVVMFPTAFCAGMTLPLITAVLMRQGYGEPSIGTVYAFNTGGAIAGVFFAIHAGLPLLGLKGVVMVGAGVDILLGILLMGIADSGMRSRRMATAGAAVVIVAAAAQFITLDPYNMASGVYRLGQLQSREESELLFHKDGKTATVSVFRGTDGTMNIRTNGKADAMMQMDPTRQVTPDELTMVLLAALPLSSASRVDSVAVIGFGSGRTTATILLDDRVQRVDTIDIEPAMVEAARNFGPVVARAYTDPRSSIHFDDAKTFFASRPGTYDIIISEPSNPWVSGVSSLFSREYYGLVSSRLADGGIFCQWLQLYELDNELVVSVLKALSMHFRHIALYMSQNFDLVILAGNGQSIIEPDIAVLQGREINGALQRIRVGAMQDIAIRRIGDERLFGPYIRSSPVAPNSDYYPILDQRAERCRFLNAKALQIAMLAYQPLPLQRLLAPSKHAWAGQEINATEHFTPTILTVSARKLYDRALGITRGPVILVPSMADHTRRLELLLSGGCEVQEQERIGALYQTVGMAMIPFLRKDESARLLHALEAGQCRSRFSPHERQWLAMLRAIGNGNGRAMAEAGDAVLQSGKDLPGGPLSYAVAVEITGTVMEGHGERSLQLWREYRQQLYGADEPAVFFQVLAALGTGE